MTKDDKRAYFFSTSDPEAIEQWKDFLARRDAYSEQTADVRLRYPNYEYHAAREAYDEYQEKQT